MSDGPDPLSHALPRGRGRDRSESDGRRTGGERSGPETAGGDAAPDPRDVSVCIVCGGTAEARKCKIVCGNCGYTRDCSDP